MERILRAEPGWQDLVADALRRARRPIRVDPRFLPRADTTTDGSVDTAGTRPRYDRASMPPARSAATLLLLYPGDDGELALPLTVRNAALRSHAGEVSLPGGAREPSDPSLEATALRETAEEIGIDPSQLTILGSLDTVWIQPSNFDLRPYVAAARQRPEMAPHSDEVTLIVELPVRDLLHEGAITEELIHGPGWTLRVGGYRAGGQLVWGATARTLAMFASVLQATSPEAVSGAS